MSNNKTKLISLSVVIIISALVLGYTLFIFKGGFSINSGINLLIALVIFLALFAFQALLIQRSFLVVGLCLLETLALLAPFYKSFSLIFAGAGVASFFLLWNASWSGNKDVINTLKIDFLKISARINVRVSVAIVLIGVVSYVSALTFQDVTESVLSSTDVVVGQVANQFLPASLSGDLIGQAQKLISDQLNTVPDAIKRGIVVGFGVLLFFGIKGIMFIVNWLAALVALLIYKLLLAVKFIKLTTEEVSKENISF
ncbi:MAG: hypothetical protein Q8Q37_01220 [bacterium]|nr:hypothetical protein [bacterium]